MEEKQKQALKRKILENLRDYGAIWNEKKNQFIVENFREVQRKLAERTNSKGQDYKSKVQKYLAQSSDIDISKISPYLVKSFLMSVWAHYVTLIV